jgi:hypothetical protein
MHAIRKTYIPNICISYTLVVLCTAILNLIRDKDAELHAAWLIELGILLAFVGTIDYLISRMNFRHWFHIIAIEFILNYIIFLVGAYLLHWFGLNLESLFVFTMIFILVFTSVYYNTYLQNRQDEEYLNRLINLKKGEQTIE